MTEKRFYTIHKGVYDELKRKELHHGEITSMLNALYEENEQLKEENQELRMSPRVDVNEIESLICENQRLEKENEQLKQQLNYIQNSISEHIKHQKTELGQKALKEIIEDYNEWLLGHKEIG